jgi:hypothetical protein
MGRVGTASRHSCFGWQVAGDASGRDVMTSHPSPYRWAVIAITAVRKGRDGSPSRPFADGGAHLDRLNGGRGEPALPKTGKRTQKGDRKPVRRLWTCNHSRVPGLGHRVSGSGVQVRVQVSGNVFPTANRLPLPPDMGRAVIAITAVRNRRREVVGP